MNENMQSFEPLDGSAARPSVAGFSPVYVIAQVLALLSVVLVAVWMGHFRGGFTWSTAPTEAGLTFNYHPLFMVIGFIFLYGNAVLIYRVLRARPKRSLKLMHAGLLLASLVFATVGLRAVWISHDYVATPIPNLYSLHSWIGMTTVVLFSMQWVVGVTFFLVPGMPESLKASFKPWHVYSGAAIFVLAVVAAITGTLEKAIFLFTGGALEYNKFTSESILINCVGMTLLATGTVFILLIANPRWLRQALPEETQLTQ